MDIGAYARWVQADLVGAIEYRDFGVTLRHPSWKGLWADVESALNEFADDLKLHNRVERNRFKQSR